MSSHRNDPRPAGDGTRAKVSGTGDHAHRSATQRPAFVSSITIDVIAEVLGQSYLDGPFACIFCRRRTSLLTAYIATDTLARCGRCGREVTLGRLRRHVTEDPALARSLRRLLAVVA